MVGHVRRRLGSSAREIRFTNLPSATAWEAILSFVCTWMRKKLCGSALRITGSQGARMVDLRRISTAQGLPGSVICQIAEDNYGHLWVSSHAGILRAAKMELNRCADGEVSTVYWLSYGKAEGLASLTCSGGFQPGVGHARDGGIWFPTSKGVAIVNPANVTSNLFVPPVLIEEMLVDRRLMNLPSMSDVNTPLQIPAGRQQFEIRYTGLSFSAPDKVHFRHRLVGLDSQWTEAGTKRVAEYSYLRTEPLHGLR